MRVAAGLLVVFLAAGCRQLFGIDDTAVAADGPPIPAADAGPDGPDALRAPDAGWVTIEIRQGLAGYGGSLDTHLRQAAPDSTNGSASTVVWHGGAGVSEYGLLQFQELFEIDRIPPGVTIVSAILEVEISNPGGLPAGPVSEATVAWDESISWNTFGPVSGVQPSDLGVVVATTPTALGAAMIDVTASLQRWVMDPTTNHGWIFSPVLTNTEDCGFRSIENGPRRPFLTVTYAP